MILLMTRPASGTYFAALCPLSRNRALNVITAEKNAEPMQSSKMVKIFVAKDAKWYTAYSIATDSVLIMK
jgi:hypothetical protein